MKQLTNDQKQSMIKKIKDLLYDRAHRYDNHHLEYYIKYFENLLEVLKDYEKSDEEFWQDFMLGELVMYNNLKGEYYYRFVFDFGDTHGEDAEFYKYYEKEFTEQRQLLERYMVQTGKIAPNSKNVRKLNTLINNFLLDVVQQEKPDSEKEFCCLLPVFDDSDRDVRSSCYMKYTKYFNYGFLTLPLSAANNPKEYVRQIIHEIFHYTPIHNEVERNELFLDMTSVSFLGGWKHILTSKVDNGEIEKKVAEQTYKNGLYKIKEYMRGEINYYVHFKYGIKHNVIMNPMFLDIVSTYCVYQMSGEDFFAKLEEVNDQIIYSEDEKCRIISFWRYSAEIHCISINNFLSDVYSDIYMTVLCHVTAEEYIKMMVNSFDFARYSKHAVSPANILRFGFICKLLFNCGDWREKLFNVLKELHADGFNEKYLDNIKGYMGEYDKMVGTDDDNYFNNAMAGIVKKWLRNAEEIKKNCETTLKNLGNFNDAEYNTDMAETLNNNLELSSPCMYDIRDVRSTEKERIQIHRYIPHALYFKLRLHQHGLPRAFENSFSCNMTYGWRCNFSGYAYEDEME